jgi:hypothetical protein
VYFKTHSDELVNHMLDLIFGRQFLHRDNHANTRRSVAVLRTAGTSLRKG